ncbi:FecR domain-containing protein [Lentisphaera profundi]|uniref:FecR domain-containing protein n=1 Tax=Lentisphaera profundi TaxID=1658616 RepID=A0ABY7VVU1_9BACT|nr:LamG-like jellyroll fold domain-containing protein [Lentisphaera profundi]WDE97330.1 FecR domain-containing protein [Lentisphaera profundi]
MRKFDETRTQHLISALIDENISAEEMKELNELLQDSPEALNMYLSMTQVDMEMHQDTSLLSHYSDLKPQVKEDLPETLDRLKKSLRLFQLVAAFLLAFIAINYLVLRNQPMKEEVNGSSPGVLAHILKLSEDIKWSKAKAKVGDPIGEEVLIIQKGSINLKYENGAEIKLVGPAEYKLHDQDSATLSYGQLAARIPEAAQGFTIDAPKALITDLGTEFALNVNKQGESKIFVYEGEVVGALLGPDGNTLKHSNLYAKDAVSIDSRSGTLKTLKDTKNFIRIAESPEASLHINQSYVDAVHNSDPIAYWRFNTEDTELITNEMSTSYSGALTGKAKIENGFLVFDKGTKGAFVVDEPIQNINSQGHSIEMWVKPLERSKDMMALASLVALGKPKNNETVKHLAYFGLTPQKSFNRHSPFNFWFASRFPARSGNYGVNCYANQDYKGQHWYHLVCIKNKNSLDIYVNGQLANSVQHELGSGDKAYQFFVGQMDFHKNSWQLHGSIDEVALYDRPLSAREIETHYQSMLEK